MSPLDQEKLFYQAFPERFASLHDDPQLVRVYEQFGIGVFRRSAVLEGFDAFVRKVGFSGNRCVEIGTCNGLTAIVLARYFDEVVTIDVEPNDVKREIAAFLNVKNIRFIDVKNNAEKASVIYPMDYEGAFCDGDHARDTESDFALVEDCGDVLFHEHWAPQPSVLQLVDRLRVRESTGVTSLTRGIVTTYGKWAHWRAA
jgi:hypothetical protein